MKHRWTTALLLFAGGTLNTPRAAGKCEVPAVPAAGQQVPVTVHRLDHHQHLLSEGASATESSSRLRTVYASLIQERFATAKSSSSASSSGEDTSICSKEVAHSCYRVDG